MECPLPPFKVQWGHRSLYPLHLPFVAMNFRTEVCEQHGELWYKNVCLCCEISDLKTAKEQLLYLSPP